jgi:hypothetical protein
MINLLPDGGMNAYLTSPEASGYALLPTAYKTEEKGYRFYAAVGHGDDRYSFNEVWFAPAVVRWWSVFDENDQLHDWAREDLNHAAEEGRQVAGPPVAIRGKSAWFGSHGQSWETPELTNMVYSESELAYDSSCSETLDDLTFYVPTYLLTPLSDDAATSISSLVSFANRVNRSPWTLNVTEDTWSNWISEGEFNIGTERAGCHCPPETREEKKTTRISRDEICEIIVLNTDALCRFTGECPCNWPVHTGMCECGSDDTRFYLDYKALSDAIYDGMFTVNDHILDPEYHYVWDYAVHRYLTGLHDLYDLSQDEDEELSGEDQAWFISLWQQQSPYRDLHTLQTHLLKQSELLTSSRKQQEFSHVS